MLFIEILKSVFLGIVEGITEWLPISSTGHIILVDEFLKLNVSVEFMDMFRVVIQLGAILAVVVLYFKKLMPFNLESKGGRKKRLVIDKDTIMMWVKIIFACIPAAIAGLLFDDEIDKYFYNFQTVAIALIVYGVFFIIIEKKNKTKLPKINTMNEIDFKTAFIIGVFQLLAALIPGTSRSGATILGGIMIGMSRTLAAEFTFFLAVPVMFGASLLKILKFGLVFTASELVILIAGLVSAFVMSVIAIKFLIEYIKKHSFSAFGVYRIVLGGILLMYWINKFFVK